MYDGDWKLPNRTSVSYGDKGEFVIRFPNFFASQLVRLLARRVWSRVKEGHANISAIDDAAGSLFVFFRQALLELREIFGDGSSHFFLAPVLGGRSEA